MVCPEVATAKSPGRPFDFSQWHEAADHLAQDSDTNAVPSISEQNQNGIAFLRQTNRIAIYRHDQHGIRSVCAECQENFDCPNSYRIEDISEETTCVG